MLKRKNKKVVPKPFFDKKFFWRVDILKNLKNPEEKKLAEEMLNNFYASAVRLLYSSERLDKRRQVEAEIQTILRAKDRKTSLIRFFFKEFLNKEVE